MARKILVVDDQKNIVNLLSKFLFAKGFEVLTTTNSFEAFELAKKHIPDLILLDVLMPGLDGEGVAASLSKNDITKRIPIIFLTGAISEDEAVNKNRQKSTHTYISKAGNINDLTTQINAILDKTTDAR